MTRHHASSIWKTLLMGILGVILIFVLIVKTFGTVIEHDHSHFGHSHDFEEVNFEEVNFEEVNFGDDITPAPPSAAMRESEDYQKEFIASRQVTQSAFKALTDVELLEIVLFDVLPTAEIDWEALEKLPFEERVVEDALMAPMGHTHAGNIASKPHQPRLKKQFGALRYENTNYIHLVADRLPPRACSLDKNDEDVWQWCPLEDLNKLVRIRHHKPLYLGIGRLNPEAIQLIADTFLALPPETPLYGGKRTLGEVYLQLSAAAPEYIAAREAIAHYGDRKALGRYRKALRSRPDDMITFYQKFSTRQLDLSSFIAPDLVGFWLRRMDDGTDAIILESMKKAELRYDSR